MGNEYKSDKNKCNGRSFGKRVFKITKRRFWRALSIPAIFHSWPESSFYARNAAEYKFHLRTKSRARNIYNAWQRLRCYYYKSSFPFRKMWEKFKRTCRDLNWFQVKKSLQCWAWAGKIYLRHFARFGTIFTI